MPPVGAAGGMPESGGGGGMSDGGAGRFPPCSVTFCAGTSPPFGGDALVQPDARNKRAATARIAANAVIFIKPP